MLKLKNPQKKQQTKVRRELANAGSLFFFVYKTRLIMKGGDVMSRILTYTAGILTGVLAGILGTATIISYAEVMSPGTGAKFSEYMDNLAN